MKPDGPFRPIENSYLVSGTRLFAGEYPGSPPSNPTTELKQKLAGFLDAGITVFVDLTDAADGLAPYARAFDALAAERNVEIRYEQHTIRDMDVCDVAHMHRVLDVIDDSLAAGLGVYVHCWGGIGRTGMVIGCWLVRHGRSGSEALDEVNALFRTMSPKKVARHGSWGSPQTALQRQMVRGWAAQEYSMRAPADGAQQEA
ncbi:MAG TPA: protein-tyrosine phosphatase family protein [Gemmatimonadales bacterium]|nr:protein-tyrosine phosphatase family protein [Gemmatimonadales bacterium]